MCLSVVIIFLAVALISSSTCATATHRPHTMSYVHQLGRPPHSTACIQCVMVNRHVSSHQPYMTHQPFYRLLPSLVLTFSPANRASSLCPMPLTSSRQLETPWVYRSHSALHTPYPPARTALHNTAPGLYSRVGGVLRVLPSLHPHLQRVSSSPLLLLLSHPCT